MEDLSEQGCEACRAGAPRISDDELHRLMSAIPDWKIIVVDGIMQLTREFNFGDFAQAMTFSNRVGDLAEAAGHHPAILTEWGRVNVTWWSHKIRGLHKNDLIMAARTDKAHAG
ncbi:MAG: 4a-hydroxytetrahydrobiopterin dehydratase [Gammaproteobacteria bacterium]|nr:4a-hydroxytetrahydrobiopterin dehydratase [Gammaproteobacteria bacterium]